MGRIKIERPLIKKICACPCQQEFTVDWSKRNKQFIDMTHREVWRRTQPPKKQSTFHQKKSGVRPKRIYQSVSPFPL